MKQLKEQASPKAYYWGWNCPGCNTVNHEDVMECEQWTRDGYCGRFCDGTRLEKREFVNGK